MKNKYVICIPLCIVSIIIRYSISSDVDHVMALINVASILSVVYIIFNDSIECLNKKLDSNPISMEKKKNIIKNYKMWAGLSVVLLMAVIFGTYTKKYVDSLGNDIISILALGFSLMGDEISSKISDVVFDLIKNKI